MKDRLANIGINANSASFKGGLEHLVARLELVEVQVEFLRGQLACRGIPAIGQQHSAEVKENRWAVFHDHRLKGNAFQVI